MDESQDRMSETSLTIDPPEVDDREEEEAKWMQLHRQQLFSSESLVQTNKTQVDQDAEWNAELLAELNGEMDAVSESEPEENVEAEVDGEADGDAEEGEEEVLYPQFIGWMPYLASNGPALQHQHLHVPVLALRHHRRRGLPDSDSDDEGPSVAALAGYDYRAR